MKDYSFSSYEACRFILNYEIIENKIIVNYANKKTNILPYSLEKEKEILITMKNQVLNSNKFFYEKRDDLNNILLRNGILSGYFFILTIMTMINSLNYIFVIITIGYSVYFLIPVVSNLKEFKELSNDLKKHKLFLQNDITLNAVIREQPELKQRLNKKMKERILPNNQNSIPFTLNTIHNISYRELEKIYNQSEKKYESKLVNIKPKKLVKKKRVKDRI